LGLCAKERSKGFETVAKFKDKKAPQNDADQKLAKNLRPVDQPFPHKICIGLPKTRFSTATIKGFGAVDEWFKSHAWKACVG
jgi:hypothetical protein